MADRLVERLVTAIGFAVDEKSAKKAIADGKEVAKDVAKAIGTGLATGTAALAAFAVAQAASITRQSDFARSMSTTVGVWSEYEYAAASARLEAQDFRAGLISLTDAISQAGTGSKDTQALFRRLGVEWAGADGKLRTSLELLPELADGLNKLSDGDRAGALVRLFGEDDGVKMFNLISKGSAGIKQLRMEGRELGLTLDEGTTNAALALTGSLTELRGVLSGLGIALFREIGPPFGRFVERLNEALKASDGWLRLGIDRGIKALGNAFRLLDGPAGDAVAAVAAFGALFVGAQAVASVPILSSVTGAVGTLGKALGSLVTTVATAGATLLGLPLGVFAGFVAAAAGTVVAFGLIIDELLVTARGGDSVLRRMADSFGIGAEVVAFLGAELRIVTGLLEFTVGIGGEVVTVFGQIGSAMMGAFGPVLGIVNTLIDGIQWLIGAMPKGFGAILSGVSGALGLGDDSTLSRAGSFYQGMGQSIQDGPAATARFGLRTATGALNAGAGAVDGLNAQREFAEMQSRGQRSFAPATPAGGDLPPVNLTFQFNGGDRSALARQAGRQAERAVLDATDALDGR